LVLTQQHLDRYKVDEDEPFVVLLPHVAVFKRISEGKKISFRRIPEFSYKKDA
jgi:hypothetical protein